VERAYDFGVRDILNRALKQSENTLKQRVIFLNREKIKRRENALK